MISTTLQVQALGERHPGVDAQQVDAVARLMTALDKERNAAIQRRLTPRPPRTRDEPGTGGGHSAPPVWGARSAPVASGLQFAGSAGMGRTSARPGRGGGEIRRRVHGQVDQDPAVSAADDHPAERVTVVDPVRPELARTRSSSSAAFIIHLVYPMRYRIRSDTNAGRRLGARSSSGPARYQYCVIAFDLQRRNQPGFRTKGRRQARWRAHGRRSA
jgi:hypothetical protein